MKNNEKVSIVVLCIDYRFWPDALPLLKKKYGEFDLIALAGGSKNLSSPSQKADRDIVLKNIKTSVTLHKAKKIILTNHVDCSAYGGSSKFNLAAEEIEFHRSELREAADVIRKSFADLSIEQIIINHDNRGKTVLL